MREALPLDDRARLAIGLLVLCVIADGFALAANLEWNDVVERLQTGQRVTFAEVQSVDDHQGTLGVVQIVLAILTAIAFLLWYSRAYRNVIALGLRNPRYGTKGAVIGWFVPIVWFFIPKHVVNDIYRASDPDMPYGDPNYRSRPVHAVVHLWWGFLILSGFLTRFALNPDEFRPYDDQAKFFVASALANAIAAILAIVVVRMITDRVDTRRFRADDQRARVAPVGAPPSLPPPAAT